MQETLGHRILSYSLLGFSCFKVDYSNIIAPYSYKEIKSHTKSWIRVGWTKFCT